MNSAVKHLAPADLDVQANKQPRGRIWVRETIGLIDGWRQRYRQRRRLLSLPPEMLKDIGISRADAVREGSKPFWRR